MCTIVLSHFSSVRLFVTPWSVAASPLPQAPLSMGILQVRIQKYVAVPSSRGSPQPREEPRSPTLQADSFPSEPPGKPMCTNTMT